MPQLNCGTSEMLRQLKRYSRCVRRHAVAFTIEQEQRAVAGGLEVAVVSAVFLLAIDRELGAVHVQHHPLRRIDGFRLREQFSIDRNQTGKVSFLNIGDDNRPGDMSAAAL